MNFISINKTIGPTWDSKPGSQTFQASVRTIEKIISTTKSVIKKTVGEGSILNRLKKLGWPTHWSWIVSGIVTKVFQFVIVQLWSILGN